MLRQIMMKPGVRALTSENAIVCKTLSRSPSLCSPVCTYYLIKKSFWQYTYYNNGNGNAITCRNAYLLCIILPLICNNAMLRLIIVVLHNYLIGMQYGLYNIAEKVVGFIFCTNFCVCIYDTFDRFAGVCCKKLSKVSVHKNVVMTFMRCYMH